MQWYYKKTEFKDNIYTYAYSHESKDYDGIIIYNIDNQKGEVTKPCKDDEGSKFAQNWSYEHFYKVIDENFPDYKAVITG